MHIEFTNHATEQMKERNITEDEVPEIIKSGKTQKIDDVYYSRKNLGGTNFEVVYTRENYIKVITVYPL